MRNYTARLTALALSACLTFSSMTVEAFAETLSDISPAAGVAKVLDEGASGSSSSKKDTDRSQDKKDADRKSSEDRDPDKKSAGKNNSGKKIVLLDDIGREEEKKDIVKEKKSVDTEVLLAQGEPVNVEEADKDDEPVVVLEEETHSTDSTIKETADTSNPALLTVGAESATETETIAEATILSDSANLEIYEVAEEEAAEGEEESSEDEDGDDGFSMTPHKRNTEEEDFSNLVIARVHDYVNVRSEASEDSEIVGKLYNKSVGDLLEEEGDWYKIKSGNCTGYVKGEYVVTGDDAIELAKEVGTRMAVVTTTTLYVRKEASKESEVIGMVPIDDELLVMEELEGWAKVSVEEGDGYVSTEFVRLYTDFVRAESKEEEEARKAKEEAERKAAEAAARKAREKQQKASSGGKQGGQKSSSGGGASYAVSGSGNGSSVANFALQFVGNPYVYGGSSLTNGTDCSGFVMSVYRNFGVSLPHSSGGDRGVGRDVGGIGNAQAGDIVCYSGHVGIYIGGGQIVHASTPSSGIKVSNANYRKVLAVRRIF